MISAYETVTDLETNTNKRSMPYGKNTIFFEREDPYGLFTIKLQRGVVPTELRGFYTSANDAVQAINQFLNKKGILPI